MKIDEFLVQICNKNWRDILPSIRPIPNYTLRCRVDFDSVEPRAFHAATVEMVGLKICATIEDRIRCALNFRRTKSQQCVYKIQFNLEIDHSDLNN